MVSLQNSNDKMWNRIKGSGRGLKHKREKPNGAKKRNNKEVKQEPTSEISEAETERQYSSISDSQYDVRVVERTQIKN